MNVQCLALASAFNTAAPGQVTGSNCVGMAAELAGRLSHTQPTDDVETEFTLARARIDLGVDRKGMGARIRSTSVRSSKNASTGGVDGESILMRISVAEARWTESDWGLTMLAGLVQDSWVTTGNSAWGIRALEASLSQRAGWMDPSDLGTTIVWTSPKRLMTFVGQLTTGEGFRYPERNNELNHSALATFRPAMPDDASIALTGYVRGGTKGEESTRSDRMGGRVTGRIGEVNGGASYLHVLGADGLDKSEPSATSAWLTVHTPPGILAAARADFAHLGENKGSTSYYLVAVGPRLPFKGADKPTGALLLGWKQTAPSEDLQNNYAGQNIETTNTVFVQLQFKGKQTVDFE